MELQTAMKALSALTGILHDAIKEAGQEGIPSGHLYAMVMAKGVTLNVYETVIGVLENDGKIIKKGDVLFARHFVQDRKKPLMPQTLKSA